MKLGAFDFPDALHYLVAEQVWARLEPGGRATVGITSLGISLAGEVYMCRPKSVGSRIEQGRAIAVVELAKSIVSVKSPLAGVVVEINPVLTDTPEQVHRDPYGAGWIAVIEPGDLAADLARLAHGDAVAAAMREHARLYRIET